MNDSVEERYVGTNDFVTIDMAHLLAVGEELTGTPTFSLSNGHVTFESGTAAVSEAGTEISGRFNHLSAGVTRVDITCSSTLSGVVKKAYFFFRTFEAPLVVS